MSSLSDTLPQRILGQLQLLKLKLWKTNILTLGLQLGDIWYCIFLIYWMLIYYSQFWRSSFFFFFDATFGDLHLFILNEDPTLNSAGQQWTRGWSVLCLHLKIQRTEGNAAVQTKQNALTHFFESLFTKLCVGSLQMSEESGKIWDGIDVCVFIRDLWPLMSR